MLRAQMMDDYSEVAKGREQVRTKTAGENVYLGIAGDEKFGNRHATNGVSTANRVICINTYYDNNAHRSPVLRCVVRRDYELQKIASARSQSSGVSMSCTAVCETG